MSSNRFMCVPFYTNESRNIPVSASMDFSCSIGHIVQCEPSSHRLSQYTNKDAGNRNRTGTSVTTRGILSPVRLPVPPCRHKLYCVARTADASISRTAHEICVARAPRMQASRAPRTKTTRMGLEPTTSAVTGRRSNQLSYRAI